MNRSVVCFSVVASLVTLAPLRAQSTQVELPEGFTAADWSAIQADVIAHRHAAVPTADGFVARHDRQRWNAHFDGRGFAVEPDSGAWTFGLDLRGFGVRDSESMVTTPVATRAIGTRVEYDWSAALTEWYVNDQRGVEHGYTLGERPTGSADLPLSFLLDVRGELVPTVHSSGRSVAFARPDGSPALDYAGLVVYDADGREFDAGFRATPDGLVLSVDDRGARYPLTIDPVTQDAYIKAHNTSPEDFLGWSVAIDGDTAVCGAWGEASNATGIDGDGTNESAGASGAAYVYVRNAGVWTQQAYIKPSNTFQLDRFGWSVSISGDTVVVGAPLEDSAATGVNGNDGNNGALDAGAAYVFVRVAGVWSQQAYLKAHNTESDDQFGYSVAISGDTIVVGADLEDSDGNGINNGRNDNSALDAGAAYVFVRTAGVWSQQAYLKSSASDAGDHFGYAVAIQGDTVIVGAPDEDSSATAINGSRIDNLAPSAGAAFVFVRTAGVWSQQAFLKASDGLAGAKLGYAVAISDERAVVGAPSAGGSGSAYVFSRALALWTQDAILKASNPDLGDEFGASVGISGTQIVVGAHLEKSNAIGIDGNGLDNSRIQPGAAYVYELFAGVWGFKSYIKASNTGIADEFGYSVAISGETAIIGAPVESSNATGINGDEGNDDFGGAGAAYVYAVPLTEIENPPPPCGWQPASVLVYPLQRSSLSNPAVFTVVNLTNTSRDCATKVHYQYVNVGAPKNPFFFGDCNISDRVEMLTPADTKSVLTSCHNAGTNTQGYLVVSAQDPDKIDTPWCFNYLIGSEHIVSINGGMYALTPLPICSLQGDKLPTDLDGDGKLDFDNKEYVGLADELYIDSYIGGLQGDLVLISFLGGEYLNLVDFLIYNDNEFQLSGQYSFACWSRVPLAEVSGYFTAQGLLTTPTSTSELDLNCDGLEDINTGWAIVRGKSAISITSDNIDDPVILGALANDNVPYMNARLLWESTKKQFNGQFPN